MPSKNKAALLTIDLALTNLHEALELASEALVSAAPEMKLFTLDGRLHLQSPQHACREPAYAEFLALLSRAARFVRNGKPAKPDRDLADALRANPPTGVPVIERILRGPVLSPGGRLVSKEGYDADSRLFIASPSTEPPPDHPTEEEVQGALEAIGRPLQDFPFADEASKAAAVALLVTFFVRPHVTGCTPLFVIEAPAPGTGKTLLALTLYAAFSKERALVTTLPASGSEEEVRRKLFSSLSKHPDILVFDNISARLASDSLAAIITSPDFSDRVIGSSETRTHRNEAVLVATGNNVSASEDLARRTVRIRLDTRSETPAAGRDFAIQDLPSWVEKNRPDLRHAVLVLIQNWLAKGRPSGPRRMASFEQFSNVVGGVLATAGLPDFLNAPKLVDTETEVLRALVSAWWERHGHHPITAQDFLRLCEDTQQWPGSMARAKQSEQGRLQSTGLFLSGLRDRVIAGQRICVGWASRSKTNTYFLSAADADGDLRGGTGTSTSKFEGGLIVVGGGEGVPPSPKSPQVPAVRDAGGEP